MKITLSHQTTPELCKAMQAEITSAPTYED